MNQPAPVNTAIKPTNLFLRIAIIVIAIGATGFGTWYYLSKSGNSSQAGPTIITHSLKDTADVPPVTPPDMKAEFDSKLLHITNGDTSGLWPVKTAYPLPGALLPYKRILAFYGNLYSKQMGILGELPPDQMLQKLQEEVKAWQAADTIIEVVPALHYIAVTAQQAPGKGGKHRLRMPFHQIDSILSLAKRINALVFIDIQVGLSTLQQEIPELVNYLKMPHVHLGIDPEFSMKGGHAPGKVVGTFDAADINYAAEYLAKLVKENNLPPKVLVIHRFTRNMVTNTRQIRTRPEVQLVMDMDGWGGPQLKFNTYRQFIYRDPVEFPGLNCFIKTTQKIITGC